MSLDPVNTFTSFTTNKLPKSGVNGVLSTSTRCGDGRWGMEEEGANCTVTVPKFDFLILLNQERCLQLPEVSPRTC